MKKSILGFGGARLLLAAAAFGMIFQLTGCTSGGEQNDVEAVQDVESLDTGAVDGGDDALLSDSLPEDALGSDLAATPSALDEATMDAPTEMTDTAMEPPSMVAEEAPPADMAMEPSSSEEHLNEISSTETPVEDSIPEPAPKKANIPLQKVAATPWKSGRHWINAVYFARPGDTLDGISQMIYGEDHTEELQKVNPTYKNREPRPGDKVYYSSVRRPNDSSQVLTWQEENGQTPQIYVAKSGDNIRSLSKELLGFDGAWKEVWSSNASVESKGSLEEGTELRYWPGAASAPGEQVASGNMENNFPPPAEPMPEAPPMEMPPVPDMAAEMPPPPPMPEEMDNFPPPPPEPAQAMNELPPPPPPMEMAPPPPPPPPMEHQNQAVVQESSAMDEDTMMALGTVAVAAAGIAGILVVRRRRKQKELENQFGDSTHVGS